MRNRTAAPTRLKTTANITVKGSAEFDDYEIYLILTVPRLVPKFLTVSNMS